MQEATNRAVTILDAKYKKADLLQVVNKSSKHLTVSQQNRLLRLLLEFEELFDRKLSDRKTVHEKFQLKPGTTPYHGRAFQSPTSIWKLLRKRWQGW